MGKKRKSFTQGIRNSSLLNKSAHLNKIGIRAFQKGHYLESAIIYFQTVEFCLRLVIHLLAMRAGVSESPTKIVEDEQSFYRLVLYLDLLKPGNILSQRLLKFNKHRNEFIHGLYYAELSEAYENKLKSFCLEGKDLIHRLLTEIGLREDD